MHFAPTSSLPRCSGLIVPKRGFQHTPQLPWGKGLFFLNFFFSFFLLFPASHSSPCRQQPSPCPRPSRPGWQGCGCGRCPLPRACRACAAVCPRSRCHPAPARRSGAAARGTALLCPPGCGAGPWRTPSAWAAPVRQQQGDISLLPRRSANSCAVGSSSPASRHPRAAPGRAVRVPPCRQLLSGSGAGATAPSPPGPSLGTRMPCPPFSPSPLRTPPCSASRNTGIHRP